MMACEDAEWNGSVDHAVGLAVNPKGVESEEKCMDGSGTGSLIAEAIKATNQTHLENGPRGNSSKGCYDSGQLLLSLRESGNKTGLMAKLGPPISASLKAGNATALKAREKYLDRQKLYIKRLAEKRRIEEEQNQEQEKKFNSLRERLKDKVAFELENKLNLTFSVHNNLVVHRACIHWCIEFNTLVWGATTYPRCTTCRAL